MAACLANAQSPQPGYHGPLKYVCEPTELAEWTIEVSSRLESKQANAYGPGNLVKGPETAWVEGAKGNGIGERIRISQAGGSQKMKFQKILIWNGYQKSAKSFNENARVRELRLTWPGGTHVVELQDKTGEQSIRLPSPLNVPWIQFEIVSVYPGSKYQDTALSGLSLNLEEFQYEGANADPISTTHPARST
ncbi:hypothetical protein [Prosthecobacter sp.]|uniref:NADase-type glycan-binding domain-containing protein n=1 Tax=Prosthecobacter sp. TaxID=1965333 RepID=UPI0025F82CBC|nr:hypothetical protein [Prosthecobacter sp.]